MQEPRKIVADTSAIINGQLVEQIEAGSIRNAQIIIPQAVFDELQSQASNNREQGFVGLDKAKSLRELSGSHGLEILQKGEHTSGQDIELAGGGRIDALITDMARQEGATLYTSDRVQHLAAQAQGVDTVFLRTVTESRDMEFLKFFDDSTMSVHLKENLHPLAKRGRPGAFSLERIGDETLSRDYLKMISSQILAAAGATGSSTAEISMTGASVIQHGDYRIAITHPPFSESLEVTIVHPVARLSMEDYEISEKLMQRFSDAAEGIVIAGAPGSGKSTLASGLANFYHQKGKIVKTFESPRDLQVDRGITQYSKLDGSFDNTADILLLVRPDYTIFDEVRRREDFGTFADLRLTGVGMVGVVHANSPLDAIQRFIGKIELGIIPSVLDTVVYIKDGGIDKVYSLELKVKVPSGMTEADLARPVIEIRNFADNALEHEIYTFGEENVIVPVSKDAPKAGGIAKLAEDKIRETFRRYDPRAEVEIVSAGRVKVVVDRRSVRSIIGRGGSNIGEIEKSLGVRVDVVQKDGDVDGDGGGEPRERERGRGRPQPQGQGRGEPASDVPFTFSESGGALLLAVGREHASMYADIHAGDRYVTSVRVGRRGQIKIPKRTQAAREITSLASSRGDIRVSIRGSGSSP